MHSQFALNLTELPFLLLNPVLIFNIQFLDHVCRRFKCEVTFMASFYQFDILLNLAPELPVCLVTLAIACRAICCIGELDQPQSVTTSTTFGGNQVPPRQQGQDPKHQSGNKQLPPSQDPSANV